MAKSKQIGVRFDLDMLEMMKEDKIADSPQKALNFLSAFWNKNREKPNFTEMFKNSKLSSTQVPIKSLETKEGRQKFNETLIPESKIADLPQKVKENKKESKVIPKKAPVSAPNEPKEGSMAFYNKYNALTYAEIKK